MTVILRSSVPSFAVLQSPHLDIADPGTPPPPADTIAPTLSIPTAAQTGSSTANVGVTTNEGNGTLYYVVTTSATAPTALQVEAGQNNLGTAAAASGSQAVTTAGVIAFAVVGLAAATAYYVFFMHKDAAGNRSVVTTGTSFTTGLSSSITAPTIAFLSGYVAGSAITALDVSNIQLTSGTGQVQAGNYLMLEWVSGTTPATNSNGTYSTSSQTVNYLQHLITESEITTAEDGTGNMRFDLTADPWLSSAGGAGSVPTGTGRLHAYIMRGDLSTLSPMSNQLSFAISASIAKWTTTNGALKSVDVNVLAGNLQAQGNTGVGAWVSIAADHVAAGTKPVFEVSLDALSTESDNAIALGFFNGTTNFSTGASRPGVSDSNGIIVQMSANGTNCDWFMSGTGLSGSFTFPSANQLTDILRLEEDLAAAAGSQSLKIVRIRGGVAAAIGTISGKTLTGLTRAFASMRSNVKFTANFGGTAFSPAQDAGYDAIYA